MRTPSLVLVFVHRASAHFGRLRAALGCCLIAAAALAGCAGSGGAFRTTVAQRAAFDMSCQNVTVQNIGGDSYGVSGCGKKASYTCICMYSVMGSCTQPVCTLDGASTPTSASQAPAAGR